MSFERLTLDLRDGIAEITLSRPEAANAIDLAAAEELAEAALFCERNPAVRAALLRAQGPLFSAGGDVRSFGASGDDLAALLRRITAPLHAAISCFARMDAPLVAAVGGTAAGAGLSLACAADLVVASNKARFTMAYTRIGMSPDGGSTWFLPRRIGLARARDLMLRNRVLGAEEALAWGLVDEVVEHDALDDAALALARQLADGPTRAYGAVKRLLADTFDHGLETQLERESRAIAAMGETADGREGIAAFLAKRTPVFQGK